jgi:hypothetical protein
MENLQLRYILTDNYTSLTYQIQSVCNTAKFFCHRVFSHPNIFFPDDETTIPTLQTRITQTVEILESVDKASFDAASFDAEKLLTEPVMMETKVGNFKFENGQTLSE